MPVKRPLTMVGTPAFQHRNKVCSYILAGCVAVGGFYIWLLGDRFSRAASDSWFAKLDSYLPQHGSFDPMQGTLFGKSSEQLKAEQEAEALGDSYRVNS